MQCGEHCDSVRWVPGHSGVEGNEQAGQHAREAAEGGLETILGSETVSPASLKRQRTERAYKLWREDIARRNHGRTTFKAPAEGARPRIREGLRAAPKGLAARFYQLASGHAMTAPFLKDRSTSGG